MNPHQASQPAVAAQSYQPAQSQAGNNSTLNGEHILAVASNNMRDGRLVLDQAFTDDHGEKKYHAHYSPNRAMNVMRSNFSDFTPCQTDIVRKYLEYYKKQFAEEQKVAPIKLSPMEDGQVSVIEGHHRFVAGLMLGKKIPLIVNTKIDPYGFHEKDWKDVDITDGSESE